MLLLLLLQLLLQAPHLLLHCRQLLCCGCSTLALLLRLLQLLLQLQDLAEALARLHLSGVQVLLELLLSLLQLLHLLLRCCQLLLQFCYHAGGSSVCIAGRQGGQLQLGLVSAQLLQLLVE
jgi:hypothetical protein